MDTSEKYIEMCRKASEIQNLWEPQTWDFIYNQSAFTEPYGAVLPENIADSGFYGPYIEPNGKIVDGYEDIFWLPRQDQLQEMVDRNDLIVGFYKYATGNDQNCELSLSRANLSGSMEQLWLAFVMKIKHNKSWNGENWILDKT